MKIPKNKREKLINDTLSKDIPTIIKKFKNYTLKYTSEIISEHLGKLTITEGSDDDLLKKLDMQDGIDGIAKKGKYTRSISLRFSNTKMLDGSYWKTFTYRESELTKKHLSIKHRSLIPEIDIQTSFDVETNDVLSVRYTGTREIVKLWKDHKYCIDRNCGCKDGVSEKINKTNKENPVSFLAFNVDWIKQHTTVVEWTPQIGWDGPPLLKW